MKFKLPVKMWETLQPIVDANRQYLRPVASNNHPFYVEHTNRESGFYFRLAIQSNFKYSVEIHPGSSTIVKVKQHPDRNTEEVKGLFQMWLDTLLRYEKQHTMYDDPLSTHQKYYEQHFSVNEPDADYTPFDIPRIFMLSSHLEDIKGYLAENSMVNPETSEIIKDCDNLIQELPVLPKNTVISKLSRIWAKITKLSVSLGKGLWKEFQKELKKQLLEKGAEGVIDVFL